MSAAETLLSWSHLDQPDVWSPETRMSHETALDTIRADVRPRLWRMAPVENGTGDRRVAPALLVHEGGAAWRLPAPAWSGDPDMGCDWVEAWRDCRHPVTFMRNVEPLCAETQATLAACVMFRSAIRYAGRSQRTAMRMIEAMETFATGAQSEAEFNRVREAHASVRGSLRRLVSSAKNLGSSAMEFLTGLVNMGNEEEPLDVAVDDLLMAFGADARVSIDDRTRINAQFADIARKHMTASVIVEGLIVHRRADLVLA